MNSSGHMAKGEATAKLLSRAKGLGLQLAAVIVDAIFLCLWVLVQFVVDIVISWLELSEIGTWVLLVFQGIFAFATLIPVLVWLYVDIRVIIIRAAQRIDSELSNRPQADE